MAVEQLLMEITEKQGPFTVEGSPVSVPASTDSILLLSQDLLRSSIILYNNSSGFSFVTFGPTSSISQFSHKMGPSSFWLIGTEHCGNELSAVWSNNNGSMMITVFK